MVNDQPASGYTPTLDEARQQFAKQYPDLPADPEDLAAFDRVIESVWAEERERIAVLLDGIDRTQDDGGWWETSTGAEHGAAILAAIRAGSVDTHTDTPGEDTRD